MDFNSAMSQLQSILTDELNFYKMGPKDGIQKEDKSEELDLTKIDLKCLTEKNGEGSIVSLLSEECSYNPHLVARRRGAHRRGRPPPGLPDHVKLGTGPL